MERNKGWKTLLPIISLLQFFIYTAQAQQGINPLQVIIEQEKWDVSSAPEEVDINAIVDYNEDLLENPVNLGEINPLDLLRLGLLDKEETEALYQYLLDYGAMVSVYELKMVTGIPDEKIAELSRYICVHTTANKLPAIKDLLKFPHFEILMSGKRVLETKAAYIRDTTITSLSNQYRGSPWQQKINLRGSFGRNITIGFSGKNDAGEQGISSIKRFIFDDKSFFLGINNLGAVKKIVLGKYGVSFGQGLCIGSGSGIGLSKEADLRLQSRGVFPSLTMNPSTSFNGVALWFKPGALNLCMFFSNRKIDATLTASDSLSNTLYYTSLLPSNYHRTISEINKKQNLTENDAGFYLSGGGEQWKSGLSILYHNLDGKSSPSLEPYKFFSQQQGNFWLGWDNVVFFKNLSVFHELCLSSNGKLAGVGGLSFSPAPLVKSSIVVDVIPGYWNNPHCSNSLSSSSGTNQLDITSNCVFMLNRKLEVKLINENTKYRWLRYYTTAPSDKVMYHIIFTYKPSRNSQLDFFYKLAEDQQNVKTQGKIDSLFQNRRNSSGVQCKFNPDNFFSYKLSARFVKNRKENSSYAEGWLIAQDVGFIAKKKKFKVNLHLAFFDTDSYDERIYAWESDVYRGFSVPAYYGQGYQYAFVMQYKWNKWIDSWLKYSVFYYPNQTLIGSGSEQISGNKKSELTLELRLMFLKNRK